MLDTVSIEECGVICATVLVTHDDQPVASAPVRLTSDIDGVLYGLKGESDQNGEVTLCYDGPLTPGAHHLSGSVCDGCEGATALVNVSPFGSSMGFSRAGPSGIEAAPPALLSASPDPLFEPSGDGWDSTDVMSPGVIWFNGSQHLFYAGSGGDKYYQIGVASRSSEKDPFVRQSNDPLSALADPTYGAYGQNAPHPIKVGDEIWLYYSAASLPDGGQNIGLAVSDDGESFAIHPNSPILTPTDEAGEAFDWRGVAHPTVLNHSGVFELWYASGTLAVGYAISEDGVTFNRYCGNPVFTGADGWDHAEVKAPDVTFDGEFYHMTYSGCDGCYQIGHASSADGLHWNPSNEPLIPAGITPYALQAASTSFVELTDDGWLVWLAGNNGEEQQIGVIEMTAPTP